MPNPIVFPCPACGGTLSADQSIVSLQCQFCGTTVMVPASMRGTPPQPGPAYSIPPAPYVMPMMYTGIPDTNRIWRGVFGLNIAITLMVVVLTGCITIATLLPFGLMMFPGVWTGLAHLFSQLTSH